MKRTRIAIALLPILCLSKVLAQVVEHGESFVLNGTLNASQSFEYKASNFIQLEKGFFSLPLSPNYAMMEIDPYFNPETPYQNMYWQPEDCMNMGRLGFYPMDFDVNENGAAVISMPLEFPEGINGLTPHLSLNYNSQAGNGIMGLGWSLGGMSKISRVPYTYMYNDSCHSVQFSNTDELSLDGVILRKGQKDGAVCYYPEIYDYSIVYPIGGNIANGFRVLKKDGLVYTYDAKYYLQSQIETPIEWHLSRVEDPFGNFIQYEYENDRSNGAFWPTSIRYTGHSEMAPQYEIVFHYDEHDTRDDCPRKWFSKPGQHNKTGYSRVTKKLDSVQCWFGGREIMSYKLTYVTNPHYWNIRMLSYVEKSFFGNNGAKWSYNTLIPTRFLWKETDYQLQYDSVQVAPVTNTYYNYYEGNNWHQFAAFAARFEENKLDGTQKYEQDIVHLMKRDYGASKYHLSIYRSGNIIGEQGQLYRFDPYDCSYFNHPQNGFFADSRSVMAFMPADTDGDGLNEIVCVYSLGGNTKISLINYDETIGFHDVVVNSNLGDPSYYAANSFRVADFNGDGLSDLFFIFMNHPHVLMSEAGRPLSILANTGWWSSQNRRIEIGDFNGDKKDQIVILMKDQNPIAKLFKVVPNQAGGFVMVQQSLPTEIANYYYASASNPCYRMCTGDFNGDGKKDVLLQCHQSWRFYFSQGNGAFADAVLVSDATYTNDDFVSVKEDNTNIPNYALVADLDDDGCDDISIIKVSRFDGPSLNVPNHTVPYRGAFRRDFLIRMAGDGSVRVKTIKNLKTWWNNGNLLSADRCIDSIEYDITIEYSRTNPFFPIMGNHKGTSPTEIMCCRLCDRYNPDNLGVKLNNTGCLGNPPVRAVNKIVTSLGATTEMEYRPVSYQFARNEIFGREDEETVEDGRSLTAVLPYHGYMNIVEKVMTETMDDSSPVSQPSKTFRKTRYHFSRPYYHTRGRGFLGFEWNWSRQQGQAPCDDIFTKRTYKLNETYSVLAPESSDRYRFTSSNSNNKSYISRTSFTYLFQGNTEFDPSLGQIPDDVFSPYLQETVTERRDGPPVNFEKEVFVKDGFGNVERYEHRYGASATSFPYYEKQETTYDNTLSASRWILGVPKTETLTQRLCLVDVWKVVRETTYENDMGTGRHTEKCTEPGDEKQLKETYVYDIYGNLTSTLTEGSGQTRTSSVAYSDDGRFAIACTNALGHTTRYHYDNATGRLDSIVDPNGLATSYSYDILGNLVQTRYPSGVLEDQSMWWVRASQNQTCHPDAPNFGGPVYFTYSKRSGEAESYVFYDQHNRKLREVGSTMDGKKTYVDYKYYDTSGLLRQVSNPYFGTTGENPLFSTYQYDHLGRNTRIDRADGGYSTHAYNSSRETVVGFDGQTTYLEYDLTGQIGSSTTNGNTIIYLYDGDGKLNQTRVNSDPATGIYYTYDINRNPETVRDPSLGTLTYDHNAFGELAHSTTPRSVTSYTYDALGRMTQRSGTDGNSRWNYDNGFIGTLSNSVYEPATGPVVKENFSYDGFGRMTRQTQKLGDEEEWEFSYTYDRLGRQSSITYPSGKKFRYHYDGNGFMESVKDAETGETLWQADATDRWGNITGFTEGDIAVAYEHDPVTGLVTSIGATRNGQALLDQSYRWTATGNLEWRTDETLDLKERFGYDGFNRLVSATTRNLAETQTYSVQSFDYDLRGNITQKTGVGSYAYNNNANPYAVTRMLPEEGQESLFRHQQATYTAFDKLRTLEQGNYRLAVDYGIDRQRVGQTFRRGSTTRTKRHFTPLYETVTENGVTKKLHYLTAATGLFAIFAEQTNGASAMHYTLKDHQGSLTATICGNAVERLSYDAWGRRRNPNGFGYSNVSHTFDRGFTLHEHYDDFNLINMNGRMYDPVIGRMLSPDIAIQDEYNAQAYNRYSYCFNNPLRFTDPSGYFVKDYWDPFSEYRPDLIKVSIDERTGRLATGISYDTKESQGMEHYLPFTYTFGEGNPNADDVLFSKTGACLEASLGEICARLGFPYSHDDASKWHEKSADYHEYLVEKYQDKIRSKEIDENRLYGNNPKYTQDYIEWTNNGKYTAYKATRFNEVWLIPDAYEERSQVLIAADLKHMEGHAGVINTYSHNAVERFTIGDPSPVRLFLKQVISIPPYYPKPYKGNATFFKIKGL